MERGKIEKRIICLHGIEADYYKDGTCYESEYDIPITRFSMKEIEKLLSGEEVCIPHVANAYFRLTGESDPLRTVIVRWH